MKTFEVTLDYDPAVLEVLSFQEGSLFAESGHPTFWHPYEEELDTQIHVVDAILGHGLDVPASGQLFSVTLKGLERTLTHLSFRETKIGVLNADQSQVVYVPDVVAPAVDVALPVEFSAFRSLVLRDSVKLEWETSSERGALGFNVYRIDEHSGDTTKLNGALIDPLVADTARHMYSFVDDSVRQGSTYRYFVESVDLLGHMNRTEHITVNIRSKDTTWAGVRRSAMR